MFLEGGGASQFKSSPMTIPSLAVPPAPHQVNVAGSMIPPTLALGLGASNTCAKCGVTFRMTSDLVYHMRTHHSKLTNTRYYQEKPNWCLNIIINHSKSLSFQL